MSSSSLPQCVLSLSPCLFLAIYPDIQKQMILLSTSRKTIKRLNQFVIQD